METLTAFTRDRDGDIRFSAETELLRRGEKASTMSVPAQQTLL